MKRLIAYVVGFLLLISAPSVAQTGDGRMEEMMGGMHGRQESVTPGQAVAREAEAAGVTVKAAYTNPGQGTPVFTIVLDTHSVELDGYRFAEVVVLRDGQGNEFRPAVITESGSGHHREATLEFKDAALRPGPLALVVKGVAGVAERVLDFEAARDTEGARPAGRE